jgi:aminoglycoside phosphotransferase
MPASTGKTKQVKELRDGDIILMGGSTVTIDHVARHMEDSPFFVAVVKDTSGSYVGMTLHEDDHVNAITDTDVGSCSEHFRRLSSDWRTQLTDLFLEVATLKEDDPFSLVFIWGSEVLKIRNPHYPKEMIANEAAALRYVAENTNIPVPRVIQEGEDYLVTSYIDGRRLDEAWNDMTEEEKDSVATHLKDILQTMYDCSSDTIRSFVGGTVEVSTSVPERKGLVYPKGPYRTVSDYLEAYRAREIAYRLAQGREISTYAEMAIPSDLEDEISLQHGDFEGRNILVADGRVTAVLDWSFAGFYPRSLHFIKGLEDFSLGHRERDFLFSFVTTDKRDITRLHNQLTVRIFLDGDDD